MEEKKEGRTDRPEINESDRSTMSQPVVVDNGQCEHEWFLIFRDGDGRNNYGCKKCMHGKVE